MFTVKLYLCWPCITMLIDRNAVMRRKCYPDNNTLVPP